MDQGRMDAEAVSVIHRSRRVRKLAVVVAAQNLLVVACLLATLYVNSLVSRLERSVTEIQGGADGQLSEDIVHIQLEEIATITGNKTLQFKYWGTKHKLEMNENKTKFLISCTGPYIWYMHVCLGKTMVDGSRGMLVMLVENDGKETPVSSIELNTTHSVCRGLSSIVYLSDNDKASIRLISSNMFLIDRVTVGLTYLLGKRCEV